jgi:nicotinamidase-related amidase
MIGPNGPLPREITAMHPNAPYIKRNGEVNAWDNEDFRNAVKATGKTQIIIAGITTDVSIALYPYSARDAHKMLFTSRCARPFSRFHSSKKDIQSMLMQTHLEH